MLSAGFCIVYLTLWMSSWCWYTSSSTVDESCVYEIQKQYSHLLWQSVSCWTTQRRRKKRRWDLNQSTPSSSSLVFFQFLFHGQILLYTLYCTTSSITHISITKKNERKGIIVNHHLSIVATAVDYGRSSRCHLLFVLIDFIHSLSHSFIHSSTRSDVWNLTRSFVLVPETGYRLLINASSPFAY